MMNGIDGAEVVVTGDIFAYEHGGYHSNNYLHVRWTLRKKWILSRVFEHTAMPAVMLGQICLRIKTRTVYKKNHR